MIKDKKEYEREKKRRQRAMMSPEKKEYQREKKRLQRTQMSPEKKALEQEKKYLYRQNPTGREKNAERQKRHRERKREEKEKLKETEGKCQLFKNIQQEAIKREKKATEEANALKLMMFPEEVENQESIGMKKWVADQHAQAPLRLIALAEQLKHREPEIVNCVLTSTSRLSYKECGGWKTLMRRCLTTRPSSRPSKKRNKVDKTSDQ